MSITHLLEDFTVSASGGAVHMLDDEALEEQRLEAFERGYGAGWEDATAAQERGRDQLGAELTAALSDLSFTYQEALTRMMLSLEPMFDSLARTVLPDILDQGFAARLTGQLTEMAQGQIGQPMQLLVPAGTGDQIQAMLPQDLTPAVKVIEDASMQPGQARIQVGIARREVDCGALMASITGAFDAYTFEAKEALSHE